MDRFIELIKAQSHAEFRLLVEYWWLWLIILLVALSIIIIGGDING